MKILYSTSQISKFKRHKSSQSIIFHSAKFLNRSCKRTSKIHRPNTMQRDIEKSLNPNKSLFISCVNTETTLRVIENLSWTDKQCRGSMLRKKNQSTFAKNDPFLRRIINNFEARDLPSKQQHYESWNWTRISMS